MPKTTLITGGARSGKSRFAEELAVKSGEPVLFVATATPGDEEMRQRIEEHQKARPATWSTLEVTAHIGSQILKEAGETQTVIVDCITLLVSNIIIQYSDQRLQHDAARIEQEVVDEIKGLIDCTGQVQANFIIVTNEVGLGLVPAGILGRLYRDFLGRANQMLAQRADEVYLMAAGIPVLIKP